MSLIFCLLRLLKRLGSFDLLSDPSDVGDNIVSVNLTRLAIPVEEKGLAERICGAKV